MAVGALNRETRALLACNGPEFAIQPVQIGYCNGLFFLSSWQPEIHQNNIQTFNSYLTETHHVSITKNNRLKLFKEITAVYSENHTELINLFCRQNIFCFYIISDGTYMVTIVPQRGNPTVFTVMHSYYFKDNYRRSRTN